MKEILPMKKEEKRNNNINEEKHLKTVAMLTLGCKVNQYETEAMSELFIARGYKVVGESDFADVYVINTCTVTNLGDKKSRQFIRRAKKLNKNSKVAVVGCYSQVSPDDIMKIDGVNLILGTNERKKIVDYIEDVEVWDKVCHVGDIMQVREFEELEIDNMEDRTRAFIKIQEGCNQYCSYCIIPYARGPIRSRKPENIINEVKRLVENGFTEIVLTGIHVGSYGKDLGCSSLLDIIKQVNEVEGLKRIRLSSLEPNILTDEFIETISKMEKFCRHFHLSLQSGSDTVLKRMNRKYLTDEYYNTVVKLRAAFDEPSITTDIIIGFPGETDEEFEETFEFAKKVNFAKIHVFKYSPKTGTPAAEMKKQINGNIKTERSSRLIELSDAMEKKYYEKFIGKTVNVLIEGVYHKSETKIEGLTDTYIRVAADGDEKLIGTYVDIMVESLEGEIMYGKIK